MWYEDVGWEMFVLVKGIREVFFKEMMLELRLKDDKGIFNIVKMVNIVISKVKFIYFYIKYK